MKTNIEIDLSAQEMTALMTYAAQFAAKPGQAPMFALKVSEAGDYKEISLNEAEGEEDTLFEIGNCGFERSFHSIEELVKSECDEEDFVPFDEDKYSYIEYLEEHDIDPDAVKAYLPIYREKTLAYGFSEAMMPEVQEDLSNHIFGKPAIVPVYGSSFGHEAGDFTPMVAALRKLGEALMK